MVITERQSLPVSAVQQLCVEHGWCTQGTLLDLAAIYRKVRELADVPAIGVEQLGPIAWGIVNLSETWTDLLHVMQLLAGKIVRKFEYAEGGEHNGEH